MPFLKRKSLGIAFAFAASSAMSMASTGFAHSVPVTKELIPMRTSTPDPNPFNRSINKEIEEMARNDALNAVRETELSRIIRLEHQLINIRNLRDRIEHMYGLDHPTLFEHLDRAFLQQQSLIPEIERYRGDLREALALIARGELERLELERLEIEKREGAAF